MLKRQRQVVLSFGAKDVLLLNSGSNSGDVEAGSLSVSSPPSSLSVSSSPLYSQHVALKEGDVVEVSVCSLISDPSVKRAIRITPVPALALCVWAPSTSTFTSASSSTSPSSSSSPTSSSAAFAAVDDDARAKAGRLQLMQSKHAAKIHGQRTPSSKVADTVGTGTGAGTGEEEVLFYVDDVLDNTDQAYMLAEDEDQKKGGDKAVAEADSSDDSVDTDSDFESNKTVKTCKTRWVRETILKLVYGH